MTCVTVAALSSTAFGLTAFRGSPAAIPALCVVVLLAAMSLSRPQVGVAAILIAATAGRFGVASNAVAVLALAGAAALAVVALALRHRVLDGGVVPPLAPFVFLYVFAVALSAVVAQNEVTARQLLRATVTGALLFVATSLSVRRPRDMTPLLVAAGALALAVGARAGFEYVSGAGTAVGFATQTGTVVGRATAGFPQPNQLAGFLVVVVPLAIGGAALVPSLRAPLAAAALIGALGVYASFSRAGLLAIIVTPFVFLRWRALVLAPVLVLGVVTLAPELLRERFATLTTGGTDVATRADFWSAALRIGADHPLLGVGLGGFPGAYAAAPLPGRHFLPTMFLEPPPHAHNVFLNTLAEQGLIGLSAFLALLCALVWRTWRLMRDDDGPRRLAGMTVFAALVAFMLHNLVDVTLFQSETGLFFWVLVGIISGLSTRRDTGGRSDGDVAQMRLAGVTQASAADALARARCRPKRSAARM